MNYSAVAVDRILELLPRVTTLDVARRFLEAKGLAHSARSWDRLLENRIRVHAESRALSMDELFDLLRESEEFGRQHVFLYRCTAADAARLIANARVQRVLARESLTGVFDRPKVLDKPATPTIVDVRHDDVDGKRSLVIKAVETRVYLEPPQIDDRHDVLVKRWRKVYERAVLLAELESLA